MGRDLAASSYRAAKGSLEAAEYLGLASRMLTRGQLKVNTQIMSSDKALRQLGGIIDRMSMAIVIAGLFIVRRWCTTRASSRLCLVFRSLALWATSAHWCWRLCWAAISGSTVTAASTRGRDRHRIFLSQTIAFTLGFACVRGPFA